MSDYMGKFCSQVVQKMLKMFQNHTLDIFLIFLFNLKHLIIRTVLYCLKWAWLGSRPVSHPTTSQLNHLTDNRSFWRRVFPGNGCTGTEYWQSITKQLEENAHKTKNTLRQTDILVVVNKKTSYSKPKTKPIRLGSPVKTTLLYVHIDSSYVLIFIGRKSMVAVKWLIVGWPNSIWPGFDMRQWMRRYWILRGRDAVVYLTCACLPFTLTLNPAQTLRGPWNTLRNGRYCILSA